MVPFQAPGLSLNPDSSGGLALPEAPPLDLKTPMRRCPSCGFNDEATVVVCVRCGYDHRAGRRLEDAHEAGAVSTRERVLGGTEEELYNLSRLAWISMLTPLGIGLAPFVFVRSLRCERKLGAMGELEVPLAQQVRVMATAGAVLWAAIGLFVAVTLSRGKGQDKVADAVTCRERLERVGRSLRAKAGDKPFPLKGTFPDALRALVGEGKGQLAASDLRCPQSRDLFRYHARERETLTPTTAADYVILWDQEPHPDEKGRRSFRALRFDGTVEVLNGKKPLDAALARKPFAGAPSSSGSAAQGGPSDGATSTASLPEGDEAWQRQEQRFMAFAKECDEIDPDLRNTELRVERDHFFERVGVPPQDLLPLLAKRKSLDVRRAAARMLTRAQLSDVFRRNLAKRLARDADQPTRFAAALTLRRIGQAEWLALMLDVYWQADEKLRPLAEQVLGEAAIVSKAATTEVLRAAAQLRRRMSISGDNAVVRLPPQAQANAVELLTDSSVQREARAVLYSAGPKALELLRRKLTSTNTKLRVEVFAVLDELQVSNTIKLPDYLALVEKEMDGGLQGRALRRLRDKRPPVPPELTTWVLETLRGGKASEQVKDVCRRVLAKVGRRDGVSSPEEQDEGLKLMIRDLTRPGDHDALVKELGASVRLTNVRIDRRILSAWPRIRQPQTRSRLVSLMLPRPQDESLQVILKAIEDDDQDVRTTALDVLWQAKAPRSEDFRRDAARVLAKRLKKERAPQARRTLLNLATGRYFCSKLDENDNNPTHSCSPQLLRALLGLSREKDESALRCLGTHPSRAVLDGLVDLLGRTKDDNYKSSVMSEIRNMSGVGIYSLDPKEWRREIGARQDRIKTRLKDRVRAEWRRELEVRKRAIKRREQLRKKQAG